MPGLGKNSPIILSQSRINFEALIDRHGQYVRWRRAHRCPCVTEHNRPDVHCRQCGGSGDIYDYQKDYEEVVRAVVRCGTVELPASYRDATVLEVYDEKGRRYGFEVFDTYVCLMDGALMLNNQYVDIRLRVPLVKRQERVTLEKVGGGYYRVPGIMTAPSMVDGVYYQTSGDVIAAEALTDGDGNPALITGYRRDMILADSEADILIAESVAYIMPSKFIVLSQNLTKADQAWVAAHNGDALCTVPYGFNLSENDVVTILSGSMTHKIVMEKRGDGLDDTIPEFFVSQIDAVMTGKSHFIEGVDVVLLGTNTLHWIGNQPASGEMMSITYRYHPTYRVAQELPALRSSEDQRIPRKVTLKLFSAYGEAKKVNQNG